MKKRGKFIVFEGIDGSGKTTQIELLAKRFAECGVKVETTCEPSDGPIGKLLRQVLKGDIVTNDESVAALFLADRMDHIRRENGLLAMLEEGKTVLCDRYYFSSYAYHSVTMDMDYVIAANEIAARRLKPDVTIFFDISAEESYARITQNRETVELFEKRERLEKTREKYFEAFEKLKQKEKIVIIDASRSPEAIAEDVWEALS